MKLSKAEIRQLQEAAIQLRVDAFEENVPYLKTLGRTLDAVAGRGAAENMRGAK